MSQPRFGRLKDLHDEKIILAENAEPAELLCALREKIRTTILND
jgi:hypothetical protein